MRVTSVDALAQLRPLMRRRRNSGDRIVNLKAVLLGDTGAAMFARGCKWCVASLVVGIARITF